MISKDLYIDWKNHPVTEVYFNAIKEILDSLEESMLHGNSVENHAILAQQLGLIRAYRSVLEYSPEFNDDDYMIDDVGDIIE